MTDPPYLSRFVVDSESDPDGWRAFRSTGIGASDAASFAKESSAELYARAKFKEALSPFRGNAHTETGHRWEAASVASAGFEFNTAMYHAADNPRFFATPDGIRVEADGRVRLAEAKAVLVRNFDPSVWEPKVPPAHRRQIAWAQYVMGAFSTDYIVLPYDENHRPLRMVPVVIPIPRDEQLILQLRRIATPVLAAMVAAHEFERTMHHD